MSDSRISRRIDEKRIEKQAGIAPDVMPPPKKEADADMPKCDTCRYMWDCGVNPQTLKRFLECRFGPPHATTIPGGGGIGRFASFPIVAPEAWCYQHQPKNPPSIAAP
jgi:hypothetical protein